MKLKVVLSSLFLVILLTVLTKAQTPPRLIHRNRTGIISYFKTIIKDSLMLVGQQCEQGVNANDASQAYDTYVEPLRKNTNHYPALIGVDYGSYGNTDLNFINQTAIRHWKKGGLVTIHWGADNPFQDGPYNCRLNSIVFAKFIDFKKLLKNAPDSKEKASYRAELLKVGRALQQLKKAGVTVLWRPFHEMNGPWFWWCVNDREQPTNKNDFVLLWRDMYNYFTNDLKLDNLIWVYSPNASDKNTASVLVDYPGANYVDIIGVDIYDDKQQFKDYDALKTLNKPIVIPELGPRLQKVCGGNYDEINIIKTFKGKAAYFLQWASWTDSKVAIIDNPRYKDMMNDRSIVTLEKLK